MTQKFQQFLTNNPSITEIREFSQKERYTTLYQDGLLKVLEGSTTIEEVERIVGKAEAPELEKETKTDEIAKIQQEEQPTDSLLEDIGLEDLKGIGEKAPPNEKAQ